eukprot:1148103-Pelagomonas_calceolata.AAC.10
MSAVIPLYARQQLAHARAHTHAHTHTHIHTRTHTCTHAQTHTHTPGEFCWDSAIREDACTPPLRGSTPRPSFTPPARAAGGEHGTARGAAEAATGRGVGGPCVDAMPSMLLLLPPPPPPLLCFWWMEALMGLSFEGLAWMVGGGGADAEYSRCWWLSLHTTAPSCAKPPSAAAAERACRPATDTVAMASGAAAVAAAEEEEGCWCWVGDVGAAVKKACWGGWPLVGDGKPW